jgi:hypothetical protein
VLRSVGPEGDGEVTGDQVDTDLLHDRADGALGDAVELVDVRGARGLVGADPGEHRLELAREELARVIAHLTLPTIEMGPSRREAIDLRLAKNSLAFSSASDFFFSRQIILKREWSSTITRIHL